MPTTADTRPLSERTVVALLAAVGVLNLAPVVVAARPDRMHVLYGVETEDAALQLLLRHRAVLLGLVGAGLVASAALPPLRAAATLGAVISKTSFLALAGRAYPTAQLRRVGLADTVGLAALALSEVLRRRG